ncbi:sigma-70 family RNA polymerase sigma factor [Allorhodopirellula heiligendammensis]|uniref:RNA polymerase sigma factor CnrH n=1 Tax=Allorhodopirellula heiligendammensis TaxID=2714739 RepID=A0A5C6BVC3_9BACT|nr:sigma-70 family RNA polymerase sigma factor [Allorhodopirellula heiligendammensis]TWU15166.1 RNA polymerase sigma factor CnrH [Allorhodopirellula heiligendammensis]
MEEREFESIDAHAGDSGVRQRLRQCDNAQLKKEFESLVAEHRAPLRAMVRARIEPRLRRRIDASDVVQEALLAAHRRLDQFLNQPAIPFAAWLRRMTLERLIDLRRRHYAARRSVLVEVGVSDGSAMTLAKTIGYQGNQDATDRRNESIDKVRTAVQRLSSADQQILLLRYVDRLSNVESADVLGVTSAAASKRHVRALLRLSEMLNGRS